MPAAQIRIIAGKWRSRRLQCAKVTGLRPSPDAVRERLFNWLPHDLTGKTCLDLFAGSGAFGFEAASRGASKAVMVESHPKAVQLLHRHRELLRADAVRICAMKVERFLRRPADKFDLIFVDPPFAAGELPATCEALQARDWLQTDALVYVESARDLPLPTPSNWRIIRQGECGMVQSTLFQT